MEEYSDEKYMAEVEELFGSTNVNKIK